MTTEKIIEDLKKAKDYILFILVFIVFSLPFLKEFYPTSNIALEFDYPIIEIIGVIGVYFLVISIAINFYKSDNRKEFFKRNIPIFILSLYMIWTLISCSFAENKDFAFSETPYRRDGYFTYIAYSGIFGLTFCINSKKMKKILLYSFSIIAILTIVLVQIAKYWNITNLVCTKDITIISFGQLNHYGYYLLLATSISSFLFISEKNKLCKIVNVLMYIFLLYFLIFNNTFGCYLALISTFIIYFITALFKKGKKIYIILAIILLAIISPLVNNETKQENIASQNIKTLVTDVHNIRTTDSSDVKWEHAGSGRMKLWKYGIQFFLEKPILGYGAENLGEKYKNAKINQDRPHNLLIQLATTSGLPGLILYCLAIGIILWRSLKNLDMQNPIYVVCMFSVVAYLISSMFGNSMYYTSPYYFTLLGFLFNEIINIKGK